jgi:hypothetical protein
MSLPGVANGLRRAQLAQISDPTSIAARDNPNNDGSILSRTYPGLFGQDAQPSLNAQFNAQQQQATQATIQRQGNILTLRRQQLALAEDPQTQLQLQQQRNVLNQRLLNSKLSGYGQNIYGNVNPSAATNPLGATPSTVNTGLGTGPDDDDEEDKYGSY